MPFLPFWLNHFVAPLEDESIIGATLLANTPQLMLSGIYLCSNALFTCMSSSAEWMSFCRHKKGLRVSKPEGEQRRTYFLSLPYRYSIPLAAKSILLHWIFSQSISNHRIKSYSPDQTPNPYGNVRDITANFILLYFIMIPLGGLLFLVPVGFGFRKFHANMPLARNNSMVISAACHPIRASESHGSTGKLSTKKLQYGVISEIPSGGYRVGFSENEVMPLIPGEFYK